MLVRQLVERDLLKLEDYLDHSRAKILRENERWHGTRIQLVVTGQEGIIEGCLIGRVDDDGEDRCIEIQWLEAYGQDAMWHLISHVCQWVGRAGDIVSITVGQDDIELLEGLSRWGFVQNFIEATGVWACYMRIAGISERERHGKSD